MRLLSLFDCTAHRLYIRHSRLKALLRLCVSIDSCLQTVNAFPLMRAYSKGDLQRPACAWRASSCNSPAQTEFYSPESSAFPNSLPRCIHTGNQECEKVQRKAGRIVIICQKWKKVLHHHFFFRKYKAADLFYTLQILLLLLKPQCVGF